MILIIAEKPSLARNIAAGIGKMTARSGYMEGNGYLISWAFGHLFELCDIEDYAENPPENRRWTMDNLPCFPREFRYRLRRDRDGRADSGVSRQFEVLRGLCNRPDVDTVVNAGDADREGEIIIRLCIANALSPENKARVKQVRLWLPDQTPETVAKALREMQEEGQYDNLAGEGFARTYIDWLYGVNLTRYATIKTGTLLRVGRVIVPIVKAIYDRDMAIRDFKPETYYVAVSAEKTNGEEVELVSAKKFAADKKADAEQLCALYNAADAVVTAKKTKKDTLFPGKLYSLSKLQNVLAKKYKMSMTDSLAIVQKLYEAGYLTYPRTNSEYLATAEKDKIKTILGKVAAMGYPVAFKDKKSIFDDSKIESHSALTPTFRIPEKGKLTEAEAQVYATVFRRFVAVFCREECQVEKTEITVRVGEYEDFVLRGVTILTPGWTKYDDCRTKDKVLPRLEKGEKVEHLFTPKEKETTPPKHYTVETLNNYLKNPFREDKAALDDAAQKGENGEADDAEEYRAVFEGLELGTEATRTGIIDNARKSKYIELKKDVYTILPGGIFLIESLSRMQIHMDKYKTSTLGQALKKVYRGAMTVEESVALAQAEIREVFSRKAEASPETDTDDGCFGDSVGACPLCGKEVRRGKYSYGCMGYKEGCDFRLNLQICQRVISINNARLLLQEGQTAMIRGFVGKSGKAFDARLRWDAESKKAVFCFE